MKTAITLAAAAIMAAVAVTPAKAIPIPDGTVATVGVFNPTINLASSPATYSISMGGTLNTTGTGGFTGTSGRTGTENGTLQFSSTVGTVINQAVSNFFVFSDPTRTYNFSVSSVRTDNYSNNPSGQVSTAIALYLLGNTTSTGFDATPTSLTINFNSTGGSPYSTSQTLAIPPSGQTTPVPEPLSLALLGSGLLAAGLIRRYRG